MDIFVGNLPFGAGKNDLRKLFGGFGNVDSASIVMSKTKKTPKSRGFGFVSMPDEGQARAAIEALSGKEFMGRILRVSPARPKAGGQAQAEKFVYKPGTYKGGRRTRSYMNRRGLAEVPQESKPQPRGENNPMRWRKKKENSRSWQKGPRGHKPWEKAQAQEPGPNRKVSRGRRKSP